jgi:uncharacterized protein YecE (DUF72 family)
MAVEIRVGTSGYAYKEWRGSFYPEKLKSAEMLRYYAGRFSAVEINNTFYKLPERGTLERWASEVPESFVFVLKASQRITHRQRLSPESKETVDYLLDVASALGPRLGPILFQTPPFLKKDIGRLRSFLDLLPRERPFAFEFRHETWRDDEVHETLRGRNAALVCADTDSGEAGAPVVPTADWGYLRLRRSEYDEAALSAWLARIRSQPWRQAFVFFKHEDGKPLAWPAIQTLLRGVRGGGMPPR